MSHGPPSFHQVSADFCLFRQLYNFDTPWQRYKPLIAVMVWMDILGSVSQNKASRLLPTYRQLLDQRPVADTKAHLSMSTVMGCDNTTVSIVPRPHVDDGGVVTD